MKKITPILCIIAIITVLTFTMLACDPEDGKIKPEISFPSSWPENEFTALLPKLEAGKIGHVTNYRGANRFYIAVEEITIEESLEYLELVKDSGFVVKEDDSDENFYAYSLRNEEKKCNIYFSVPTLQNSSSPEEPRNQLGLTIYTDQK